MTNASSERKLPAHTLRDIGVRAGVDPRTVARVVAGKPTKGMQRERVVAALRAAGFGHLVGAAS